MESLRVADLLLHDLVPIFYVAFLDLLRAEKWPSLAARNLVSVLSAHISDLHVDPRIRYGDISLPISRRPPYRLQANDGKCSWIADCFSGNGTGNCCYFAQDWTGENRLGWPDSKRRATQNFLLSLDG